MLKLIPRLFRRRNGLLFGILVLALFQLAPLLKTGYIGDDAANSLIPGILQYHELTLTQFTCRVISGWKCLGRFYPLAFFCTYTTFYLLSNLLLYKGFVLSLVALNLFLFYQLVRRLTHLRPFAALSTLVVLLLFQFRTDSYDPILAYSGLMQLMFLLLVVSLLYLRRFLETSSLACLSASVLLYVVLLFTYEVSYPYFIVHLFFIHCYRKGWRPLLRVGTPFVGAAALCVGLTLFLRTLPEYTAAWAYEPNRDPAAYAVALVKHHVGALPLSYAILHNRKDLFATPLAQAFTVPTTVAFLGGFVLAGIALYQLACAPRERLFASCRRLSLLGLALWTLPTLLVCLSKKYQEQVPWGTAYLPVYHEYHGVALLLTSAITLGVACCRGVKPLFLPFAGTLSVLLAVILALTNHVNHKVRHHLAHGCYLERVNLEAALHAGLLNPVPEHATLIVKNRYPLWQDDHGVFFYLQHTGKKLNLMWFPPGTPESSLAQAKPISLLSPQPPNSPAFKLIDGAPDGHIGYALLTPWEAAPGQTADKQSASPARTIRLFIHRKRSRHGDPDEPFILVAGSDRGVIHFHSQEMHVLQQGADWKVYECETAQPLRDAQLVFRP